MLSNEEFESLGYTFIWKIENFSYCLQREKDNCIVSPRFVMNSSGRQTAWYLIVYPRGLAYGSNSISYDLNKDIFFGRDKIKLDYELGILAADDSLQESIECEGDFLSSKFPYGKIKHTGHELMRQKKNMYLPNDTLTLYCCMCESGKLEWLGQSSATTRIGVEKTSIIWPIEKFKTLVINEKNTLIVQSLKAEKVYLELYLEPRMDFDANIRIQIMQSNTSQENLMSCKLSVVDSEGSLAYSTKDDHLFEKQEAVQIWNFPFPILKNSLLKDADLYLAKDTMRLQFDFATSVGVIYSELEHSELGPYESPHVNKFLRNIPQKSKVDKLSNSLVVDLKGLYVEKTSCDFSLVVGPETFPVHKAVLAARSTVFRAMITTDMLEKKTNQVVIPDMDSDTVKRMLVFMYTDTIEDPQWRHITKLYTAADKYGIQSLKQECSSFLEAKMCADNVGEALELGDMHQDNSLKDAAVEFILRNDDKILLSDEWKNLMKQNSQLAAETMHSIYLNKIRKSNGEPAT